MEFCSVRKDQADLDRDNATNISNADNDIEKFSNIAKRITYISVLWEVGLGLVSIIGFMIKLILASYGIPCAIIRLFLCCFHSESSLQIIANNITPF